MAMTEEQKQAFEMGQSSAPTQKATAIATRNADQVLDETRVQIEAISTATAEQMTEAILDRTAEKLTLAVLQNADTIVERAAKKLTGFLPKFLQKDELMVENDLDLFLAAKD